MKPTLEKLTDELSQIASMWDGDMPGAQEERAHAASEAIVKIQELSKLLEELDML